MHLLLAVNGYLFKHLGDMTLNCLLGVVNSWLVVTN
jgi:hypothetical protein